jgi:hypothetical protein
MSVETTDKKVKKESSLKRFFKPFSVKNLVWFIIGSLFNLTGLAFIITIIIGSNLNVAPSKNPVLLADTSLKALTSNTLGFLYWGIILLLLGAVIMSIVLSLASRNEDRERERQLRREQRLKQMADIEKEDVVVASTVSDASVTNSSVTK